MKEIRSFSLDRVIVDIIDDMPRNERSRKINKILRESLLGEKKKEQISMEQIRQVIASMNQGEKEIVPRKKDNQKAKSALSSIINMKDEGSA